MKRALRPSICVGALGVVVFSMSCSTLLGADFDVVLADAGLGGGSSSAGSGGGSASSSTGGSTSNSGVSSSGTGGAGCLPDQCMPEIVSIMEDFPLGLAASGDWVYWSSGGSISADGAIKRSQISAVAQNQSTVASGLVKPSQIAVDAGHVYWTSTEQIGAVYCAPLAGTADPQLVAADQTYPIGIAVDGKDVYWTASGNGFVRKVPAGCSSDLPTPFDVASGLSTPSLLAVSGNLLYVTEYANPGRLLRIHLSSLVADELVKDQNTPNGVVVAGTDVCFATSNSIGGVYCVDPASTLENVALEQAMPAALTVDSVDGALYWANQDDGTIMKAKKGAASATLVASGQKSPTGIAVAGGYVYWTNHVSLVDGGSVMRQRIH